MYIIINISEYINYYTHVVYSTVVLIIMTTFSYSYSMTSLSQF